jgi:hypothetical protein
MNRRLLALVGLIALAVLAGCLGPSEVSESALTENATYDWNRDAAASYNLSRSTYSAVFTVSNNSTLEVHNRDALGVEAAVEISALKFRFGNQTVVNATHANLSATLEQSQTVIRLPARNGQVAYTARRSGKQFSTPVVVPGRQTITLPSGTRVGLPLLSQVNPSNHTTSVENNQMTVAWANQSSGALTVHYYLQRDLLLFSLLLLVTFTLAVGGSLYYLRQIRRLEDEREDIGLDVDTEDDPGDRGPPPGMR